MYILFEKYKSSADDSIFIYDCMGYAEDEGSALKWRNENNDNRVYKYCPDKLVEV